MLIDYRSTPGSQTIKIITSIKIEMLTSVVSTNSWWRPRRGCGECELQFKQFTIIMTRCLPHLVLAAVPVAAGHGGVEAQGEELQSEEADVRAQLGEPVLTRGGGSGRGRVSGVHHVARVEADLEATPGGAEDATSPEARGTGAVS